MSKHYCRDCAQNKGYLPYVNPNTDFTGSVGSYKFEKFIKHTTQPTASIVSYFNNTDAEQYKNYIINAATSGSIEVDCKLPII